MLVVSDASPINILVRIGHIEILPRLFGAIIIPSAVNEELSHPATPPAVRTWLTATPDWLQVRTPTEAPDATLPRHRGERQAIQLAQELKADFLLMDEHRPRRVASALGISVIGTIGVLERAALARLVDLEEAVAKLRQSDFRISDRLLMQALGRHRGQADILLPADRPPDHPPDRSGGDR